MGKLFDSLASSSQCGGIGYTFVGKVKYLRDSELLEFADSHFTHGNLNTVSIAKTLTVKRNAFEHEKEVRLIYVSDDKQPEVVLKFKIDPHDLVDQIMIHPRLSVVESDRLKWRIKNYLKYTGEVNRSLLHAPPQGFEFKI